MRQSKYNTIPFQKEGKQTQVLDWDESTPESFQLTIHIPPSVKDKTEKELDRKKDDDQDGTGDSRIGSLSAR